MSLFDHAPSLLNLAATFAGVKMGAGKKTTHGRGIAALRELGSWVRYAYFLRFSIMLWLLAPALCALNEWDQTLTSGALVPETTAQYLIIGFFLVSAGFAALVSARVVIIHGPERWDTGFNPDNDARPKALVRLLDNRGGKHELRALLYSQIPTALVFLYFMMHGAHEQVSLWRIVSGLVFGAALATLFWWMENTWHYLAYEPPEQLPGESQGAQVPGENAARTILFPRRWFRGEALERAKSKAPRLGLGAFGRWLQEQPGFSRRPGQPLYEAQKFAMMAWGGFLGLYFIVWPLTAPGGARSASWILIGLLALRVAWGAWIFLTAKPARPEELRMIKPLVAAGEFVFLFAVIALYLWTHPDRFPILGIVLIMAISLHWFLSAAAFFFDRYRVPVLTLLLVVMVVPRMAHLDRFPSWHQGVFAWTGHEEHYLSTATWTPQPGQGVAVQTPARILADRLAKSADEPLIVVTATGGGLHASAWTAAVLAQLEKRFGPQFHGHLLLASTVSGGSVGLLAYLRELHEGTLDSNPALALPRMQSAAQCSSLESVGWGLVYYDLSKAIVPAIPYFIPPSPGKNDLNGSPLAKDRTWSLRRAFGRNLNDRYCDELWASDTGADPNWNKGINADAVPDRGLTLRQMAPSADGAIVPAFTMNTTTAEMGERFLLANYAVPNTQLFGEPNYRARSFLATFPKDGADLADLPLATAAQMSATFPYVSSAARVPLSIDPKVSSVHFVDGGYYDNDGTASAIEFLRYAMTPSDQEKADPAYPKPDPVARLGSEHPLRILIVEIRNSGDVSPTGEETQGDENGGKYPWNLFSQTGAPGLAFWQAGHESVTLRNRSVLALLEEALQGRLEVQRIVFDDRNSTKMVGTDPLNWSLTPRQRREVQSSAVALGLQYKQTECWLSSWDAMWRNAHSPNPLQVSVSQCLTPVAAK